MRSLRDKGTLSDVRGRDNPHAHPAGDFWLLRYPRRGRRHGNEFAPTQRTQSSLRNHQRRFAERMRRGSPGFLSSPPARANVRSTRPLNSHAFELERLRPTWVKVEPQNTSGSGAGLERLFPGLSPLFQSRGYRVNHREEKEGSVCARSSGSKVSVSLLSLHSRLVVLRFR